MWIAIDDTDSRNGGCTTYVGTEIIDYMTRRGFNLIGLPRLVRLNPNIPYKTRGNGAVVMRFGIGLGNKIRVGWINGNDIYAYEKCREIPVTEIDEIEIGVRNILKENSYIDDGNTQPCAVLSYKKPDSKLYTLAVRYLLNIEKVKTYLPESARVIELVHGARGIIGALSALSWSPIQKTYELITYRQPHRIGTPRRIDKKSVEIFDKFLDSTFNNIDYRNKYIAIAPHTPCPVLYGIRSTRYTDLEMALDIIVSEAYARWMIFETNQATDDHIVKTKISNIVPYMSVKVTAKVINAPRVIEGGHVVIKLQDETGAIDATAYEPTKEFRRIIKDLCIGDVVAVYGGVREKPYTINIEKIHIIRLSHCKVKVSNPICPNCGIKMKSRGRDQGFKCRKCGSTADRSQALYKPKPRIVKEDMWYEVPVVARRHLHKPLKLGL